MGKLFTKSVELHIVRPDSLLPTVLSLPPFLYQESKVKDLKFDASSLLTQAKTQGSGDSKHLLELSSGWRLANQLPTRCLERVKARDLLQLHCRNAEVN